MLDIFIADACLTNADMIVPGVRTAVLLPLLPWLDCWTARLLRERLRRARLVRLREPAEAVVFGLTLPLGILNNCEMINKCVRKYKGVAKTLLHANTPCGYLSNVETYMPYEGISRPLPQTCNGLCRLIV